MNNHFFYYLILLIIIYSCKNAIVVQKPDDSNCTFINVDLSRPKDYDLSLYSDSVFLVKLETNKSSIIGNIKKVICDDTLIFILDSKREVILMYNFNGKLINTISKKGHGPKEYLFLKDFNVNKLFKRIEIADPPRKRIMFFDYNGKFIGDIKLNNEFYFDLVSDNNGNFYIHNQTSNTKHNFILTMFNRKKFIKGFFEKKYNLKTYFPEMDNPITTLNNDIYFLIHCSESIYKINKGKCFEEFRFIFGNNRYSDIIKDYLQRGGYEDIVNFYKRYNLPLLIDNLFFTKKYFSITFITNDVNTFYYNIKNRSQINVKKWYSSKIMPLPFNVVGTYNEFFISPIPIENLTETFEEILKLIKKHDYKIIQENVSPYMYKELENIYKNSNTEIDNPVLLFYRLKF